jgi:hypothetical protein
MLKNALGAAFKVPAEFRARSEPSAILENESLRRVEASKVGGASCFFIQARTQHDVGRLGLLPCLLDKKSTFRLHRSMPSRISCIGGVRSR